jgi:predicted metal-dependent hydrolase
VHDLLLRPVKANGELAYRLSVKADMAKMLALAAHEVAHLSYPEHDERFAVSFTMLVGRLFARLKRR